MSKYTELFNYLRTCPQLANLWSIAGTQKEGSRVVLPQGTSPIYQYNDKIDIYGDYSCEINPYPSVHEDYQINCYEYIDSSDSSEPLTNVNLLSLEDVQSICDWITTQNENGNLPSITNKKVVSIECNPFNPQIRAVDEANNLIAYFITVRVKYVNSAQKRCIEYVC